MTDSRHGHGVTEDPVCTVRSFDVSMVFGSPPVLRRRAGVLDEFRLAWAADVLRDPGAQSLAAAVRSAAESWSDRLPQDFPASLRSGAATTTDAGELATGLAALVRSGLVVVRGMPTCCVTVTTGRLSTMGREFARHEEGLASGVYWPGGRSGVTVGPGYDMSSRDPDRIVADLVGIGVGYGDAEQLSGAAQLAGEDAHAWVEAYRGSLNLTILQQTLLMDRLVPEYETMVLTKMPFDLKSRLFQHEFDALFSLAWNTSRYGSYDFNGCIGRYDMDAAASAILTLTGGGPGIGPRRHREVGMFTRAIYDLKPMVEHPDYDDYAPPRPGAFRHA